MALRDDLFDLIHAMSPSEKRYFKLHADRHISTDYKSQYEKLFDALNNWGEEEYDEKEFKRKSKGKTFLKNLPTEKSYLYDLILKTLQNYSSRQNPELQLQEMMIHIRLLINKGLKAQAYRLIEKAEKLATGTEQLNEMLSLNDALLRLYRMGPAESRFSASEIARKGKDILQQIQITRKAVYLRIRIVDIEAQNKWSQNAEEVKEIIRETDEMIGEGILTRRAELSLINVRQFYLVHQHRYKESLDLTGDWLAKIEADNNILKYPTDQYLFMIANYLMCALRCDELHLLPAAIRRIQNIKTVNENEEVDCFRISAQYEFLYMLNTGDFQNANQALKTIEAGLVKYANIIAERQLVNFRFNIILLCFLQRKYSETLINIQKLSYISGRDEKYILTTVMSRVIEWISQARTGNHDILDGSLRSLKKYIKDRNINNDFFDALFDCFGLIIKEAGIKPASLVSIKKRIADTKVPSEWEQLKAIFSSEFEGQ